MRTIITSGLLVLMSLFLGTNKVCAQISQAEEDHLKTEQLNGYPLSSYYHLTIEVPENILNSSKKTDKMNVGMHHKMVAWEKVAQKPINSLDKLEMEALLTKFKAEVEEELGYNKIAIPKEAEFPAEKPAIIEADH